MKRKGAIINRVKLFVLAMLAGIMMSSPAQAKNIFDWRMVIYPTLPISSSAKIQELIDFTGRMQKAGFNGIFVDGAKNRSLKTLGPQVKADVQRLVAEAGKNGIAVVPMSQGQSGNTKFFDYNLDEAFPCKATRFVVSSGIARARGDTTVSLANGGFENGTTGWRILPFFKIDNTVKRSGNASLRCDDPKQDLVRASQNVQIKPYTAYELSMWVKTQNIVSHTTRYGDQKCRDIGFTVQSPLSNYIYQDRYFNNGLGINSNWKLVKTAFHSLDRTSAMIEIQATKILQYTGTVWFDDVKITEIGLYESVVRPGLSVMVKTTSGTILTEGKDYVVGNMQLTIPAGSAVHDGDELLVDWFKKANVVASHSNPAMCYDTFWNATRDEIALEDEWFGTPKARLMKYSEWRLAGWDPVCNARYQIDQVGSGRYMSDISNITNGLYKEANGSRISIVFSDAYDPWHNSRSNYYVIRGGSVGSGYDLDEDIIVMNWTVKGRSQSLSFFAGTDPTSRGVWGVKKTRQRQIISSGPGMWTDWLPRVEALEKEGKLKDGDIIGIAYHTYKPFPTHYDKIESFAEGCEAAGRWGTGPIPFPAATPGIPFDVSSSTKNRAASSTGRLSLAKTSGAHLSELSLRFSVPGNDRVRVSLYNLHGQMISRIVDQDMVTGIHERRIDISKLAPGVYYAMLSVNGGVHRVTTKMVLL